MENSRLIDVKGTYVRQVRKSIINNIGLIVHRSKKPIKSRWSLYRKERGRPRKAKFLTKEEIGILYPHATL